MNNNSSDDDQMLLEFQEQQDKDMDQWWNSLSKQDQQRAFYSVCKRIYMADVEDKGSYRHALYKVFDFDLDSYGLGMDCKFIDIHNLIKGGLDESILHDAHSIKIECLDQAHSYKSRGHGYWTVIPDKEDHTSCTIRWVSAL